jgi:CDP-diacylglycerol--serine O-phosphatidyltransferase
MATPVNFELGVALAIVTSLVALLMVSNIRYYSPKQLNMKEGVPYAYMLGIVGLFALVFANPPVVLLLIAICYISSGPIQGLLRR